MPTTNAKVIWRPQAKQIEALTRLEFEILYGGARGGGKTDCGMAWLLYDKDNPLYKALVIRRNADDLKDWVDRAKIMYQGTGAVFTGQPAEIRFPSGAVIRTGHLKDEDAYEKYQGHEYQKILIEELTQIPTELSYLKLISSCRSTVKGITAQVFTTTNPGNAGHKWVKARFIDVAEPGKQFVDRVTGRTRIFIPAKVEDNPILIERDPNYVHFLNGLPDGLRQAWRDGSWDSYEVEGSYYARELAEARKGGRICPVPHEKTIPVDTWWDLGVGDSTAIGFFQRVGREWRMIDYYEASGEGLNYYKQVLDSKGYTYRYHWAPHDIEVREMSSGRSRKDIARDLGIDFRIAPKLTIDDGINSVRMRFNTLWIDQVKCEKFLEAITNYRKEWSDKMGEFKMHPLHDWTSHAADMLRYWAVTEDMDDSFSNDYALYKQSYV